MDYSEDPESAPRGGDLGLRGGVEAEAGATTVARRGAEENSGHGERGERGRRVTPSCWWSRTSWRANATCRPPGVRERITETLRGRKEQLLRTAYITTVRRDAEVVNYLARRVVESQGKMPSLQLAAPGGK